MRGLLHGIAKVWTVPSPRFLTKTNTFSDTFLVIAFLLALSRPLAGSKLIENLRNSVASDVSGISPTHIPKCKGIVSSYIFWYDLLTLF